MVVGMVFVMVGTVMVGMVGMGMDMALAAIEKAAIEKAAMVETVEIETLVGVVVVEQRSSASAILGQTLYRRTPLPVLF